MMELTISEKGHPPHTPMGRAHSPLPAHPLGHHHSISIPSPSQSVSKALLPKAAKGQGGGKGEGSTHDHAVRPASVLPSHFEKEKIPVKVVRQMTRVHHSDLIQNYLERAGIASASTHTAVCVPMTKPEVVPSPIEDFLEALKTANTKSLAESTKHQQEYGIMKEKSEKQIARDMAGLNKQKEKNAREMALAMREASAFSKTLVSEYQDKKYGELKNPSKSLALRRLGHFRAHGGEQTGSLLAREGESAVLMSVANRPRSK